jgi:predicted Zn-dependent peptidase
MQSYLLWGTAVEITDATDHAVLEVAAHILGGWAGSRWNVLFREKLGCTYGATAAVSSVGVAGRRYCFAHAGLAVDPDAFDRTLDTLADQAAAFLGTGPRADEVNGACLRLLRTEAHYFDSSRSLMTRAGEFLLSGLGTDFAASRMAALRGMADASFTGRMRELMLKPTVVILDKERAEVAG